MNILKKSLSVLLALCLLVSVVPMAIAEETTVVVPNYTDEEWVVGRFMYEGAIADKDLSGNGWLGVTIEAPVPINISGYDVDDLAVRFTYRVTRSDGLTGPGSLSRLRNGYVDIYDSGANKRARFGSPTQNGVPGDQREAGEWLEVSYQLSAMTDGTDRLTSITLGDYNDFPNKKDDGSFEFDDGCDVGMYLEVKDVRIVDTSRDANGNEIPKYTLTTFKGFGGTYEAFNDNQWYADWKYADIYPVDLSGDRSNYRLQMTVTFDSEDETIDLNNCFSQLTIKLRSNDKSGVAGDPSGSDNTEHNIGWDFKPSDLTMENGSAFISIDLSSAGTNSRGLIDWSDIRRIITTCTVASDAKAKIGDITMTLSDVQIVDLEAVEGILASLKAVIDLEQDVTLFSETDKAVYEAALAEANAVYADAQATVADMQAALKALQAAQLAGESGKTALKAALTEEIDATAYTAETMQVYTTAKQAAQQVADDAGATVSTVANALEVLNEAKAALEPQRGVNYGDVNGKDGVTAEDALLALQAATSKITLTASQYAAADVDADKEGVVSANDALLILQYATKKINAFPAGSNSDLTALTEVVINEDPLTFCNPINLNYQYQANYNGSREAADPAVVVFKGEYWLFASHNDGYWHSSDLSDWEYIQVDMTDPVQSEFRKFAPATMVIGDYLYLTHSESGAFLRTTDPSDPDLWESLGKTYNDAGVTNWGDPALLYDDPATGGDGYVYAVEGTSPDRPIVVMKFDPNDGMKLVEGPVDAVTMDLANHGWENSGDNNTNFTGRPFLEGGWINKYNGKYYLTYALPGTADASYADGCYVADDPMGPYTYCENSPVVRKASGFVVGAGHGCLFEDMNGNWWKVETVALSVNTGFERRLAIYPAMFDEEGDLYTNTVFGDYPTYIPTESEDPFNVTGPGWTLLSYDKEVTTSSDLNRGKTGAKAVDESMRTWWSAETGDVGEYLQLDLGDLYGVWSIQLNFADQDTEDNLNRRDGDFSYKYLMEFSQDGETWYTIADRSENDSETSHDYYEFAQKLGVRYIRVTNKGAVPQNGKFAISGLRVFGDPVGIQPAQVEDFTVERYVEDERSVSISWDEVPGAQGYIIRFGTEEDQLYNHQQVIAGNGVTLHCLNMGVDYYFTVDSYGEGGVTLGTVVKKAPWTVEPIVSGGSDDSGDDNTGDDNTGDDNTGDDTDTPVQPDQPTAAEKVEGYAVYEGENATMGNGANVGSESTASGGKSVHNMHTEGAYVEFTGVDGGEGGEATLRLVYANGNSSASNVRISLNGQSVGQFSLPVTTNWNTFWVLEVALTDVLAGEENTIKLEGCNAGFNVDYIQLITS